MNRTVAPLVLLSVAALAIGGASSATAAPSAVLASDDTMYALSCPQEDNPYFSDAMQLWSVDVTTVDGTAIGSGNGDIEGLCAGQPAWDPVSKSAYAFALTDDHDDPSLLMKVDLATGTSTVVDEMYYEDEPVQVASLAIGLDGAAYALAYTQLYSVDLVTGALEPIGGSLPTTYGFAVDPTTGKFWGLAADSSLLEIDVATGQWEFGSSLEIDGASGLQIDSAGRVWAITLNDDETWLQTELWTTEIGADEQAESAGILFVSAVEQHPFSQALLIVPGALAGSPQQPQPQLAATGVDATGVLAGAATLVVLGALVLGTRRRFTS